MSDTPLIVGGLVYPGFEMLDLFGPLEMFSMLGPERARILLVGESSTAVPAAMAMDLTSGPKVLPDQTFGDAPNVDVLLVPGGFGTLPALENDALLGFIRRQSGAARIVASVCTGSVLLARAGVLDGRRATSNKQLFARATTEQAPVTWVENARWVEDGKFFTSSGVSAGMDMALAVIAHLLGEEAAVRTATAAEYTWHRDADSDPFVSHLNELADLVS